MNLMKTNRSKTVYTGAITRIGNSQGIRLPQDILKRVNLYADFSQVQGGQIPVDIVVDDENIIIRKKTEPDDDNWTKEKQSAGIAAFIEAVDSYTDEERNLIPEAVEFRKSYGIKLRKVDPADFQFEESGTRS